VQNRKPSLNSVVKSYIRGSRKPLSVEFVSSNRPDGTSIDPMLLSGLSGLTCPEDEDCSVLVKAWAPQFSVIVFVRRQKEVPTESRWIVDHPKHSEYPYIYGTLFQTESTEEIIDAVRQVLETPEIGHL